MANRPRILLLGPPEITVDGEALRLPAKQLATLAVLAEAGNRGVGRRRIARLLWPNANESRARHSLSQALYGLRNTLSKDCVVAEADFLALGGVDNDLERLDRSCAAGNWDQAALLYRGPFLGDLSFTGLIDFSHWLDGVRAKYANLALRMLEEPLGKEAAHRISSVMPGLPEAAVQEPSESISFVGRTEELKKLDVAWSRALDGEAVVALVSGAAGIGKTSLCRRFLKKVVLRGGRALDLSGYEGQKNLPFGVAGQLLNQMQTARMVQLADEPWRSILSKSLQHLVDAPDMSDSGQWLSGGDFRLATALQNALSRALAREPAALFVDDLQFVDDASAGLLQYLTRAVQGLPLLFIVATRSSLLADNVERKWRPHLTLHLEGLSLLEAESLAVGAQIEAAAAKDISIAEAHRISAGNPLLLTTLFSSPHRSPDLASTDALRYFAQQLEVLSSDSIKIGAAIAVAGGGLQASRLVWLAQIEEQSANAAVSELSRSGYVTVDDTTGEFRLQHPLIGDAFLENISPLVRAQLHRRAGMLFQDEGKPPAFVATQFAIAGSKKEAYTAAMAAATASRELFAYREAAYFFNIAVANAADAVADAHARSAFADLLLEQGRFAEARAIIEAADSAGLPRDIRGQVDAYRLLAAIEVSPPAQPLVNVAEQAAEIQADIPPELQGELFVRLSRAAFRNSLPDLARRSIRSALKAFRAAEDGSRKFKYELLAVAGAALWGGEQGDIAHITEIIKQCKSDPSTYVSGLLARATIRHTQGSAASAEEDLLAALEYCERYGLPLQRIAAANNLVVSYVERGCHSEARKWTESLLNVPTAELLSPMGFVTALSNHQTLLYEQGRHEEALQVGERLRKTARGKLSPYHIQSLGITGLAALTLGRLQQAREQETLLRSLLASDTWSHDVSYVEIFLARMSTIGGGDEEAIERLAERVEAFRNRDVYCAARMEVELLRMLARREPETVAERTGALRERLAGAGAAPLVQQLDDIVARSRLHSD